MGYALPLDQLSVDEKLAIIDEVWDSLAQSPDDLPSPEWHGEVLAERRRLIAAGETVAAPLDEVMRRLESLGE